MFSNPMVAWGSCYNPYGYNVSTVLQSLRRNKRDGGGIEAFVILPVATFRFAIVSCGKGITICRDTKIIKANSEFVSKGSENYRPPYQI